jgi:metal-responsive CopG/Arc/MetJ family transcriptional regulator
MKRTTLTLPDDLVLLLDRAARREGTSVSQVVRQAIVAYFGVGAEQPRELPFANLGRSGVAHTARDFEAQLAAERDRDRDR